MIHMTQDQYGQARGPGYVVRGDAVREDAAEEFSTGEPKPMTRFQKVASALRGGADEQDPAAADEAATASSPISRETRHEGDYWDEPGAAAANRDEAVAVTSPDVPVTQAGPEAADHPATEPDMFGTTWHAGNGTAPVRDPEGPAGAPASGAPAAANGVAAGGIPASGAPAAPEAMDTTGRHAAGTPAGSESQPGETAGTLGDFSDLTYGNLIQDAAHYSERWQQIQFRFVDDPHASVTEAADVVAQVTAKMEAAIQERQRAIEERQRAIQEQQRSLHGRWGEGTNADTEALRETLRMYKTFLDQLIGPRVS
jgi:hypothetical protein